MKLLTKNSIYFLVITSLVFLIGGKLFYMQLQTILNEETTEQLESAKEVLINYIHKNKALPVNFASMNDIRFDEVQTEVKERVVDTLLMDEMEGEHIRVRQLHFPVEVQGAHYRGIVGKSMLEADDLIETISFSFAILMIVLIIVLMVSNYIYSKLAWKPFTQMLEKISNYDINQHKTIAYSKNTNTTEFLQLSDAISKMTDKINSDYLNMKAFTENASHEIQTPLAIIKSKTELLLQNTNLNEEERKQIYEINQTAGRLSKLNQTLLLFAKIENDQYHQKEKLDLVKLVSNKLEQMEDLFTMKNINLKKDFSSTPTIEINPVLMEIVISNLLTNALKYSAQESEIEILIHQNELVIINPGNELKVDPKKLFDRFYKGDDAASTGLGLALVKEIAQLNGHKIEYSFENNKHIFKYVF